MHSVETTQLADFDAFQPGFAGLRCERCDKASPTGAVYVCSRCFGPLRATYDYGALSTRLTRDRIAGRPRTLWRYAELLPVERIPSEGLAVGWSPLVPAPRLAARRSRWCTKRTRRRDAEQGQPRPW